MITLENKVLRNNPNFFRGKYGYFCNNTPLSNLAKVVFQWRGGNCVPEYNGDIKASYIFFDSNDPKIGTLKEWYLNLSSDREIPVSIDWILESNKKKQKLELSSFLVRF